MDIKKTYNIDLNGQGVPPYVVQYLSAIGTRDTTIVGDGGEGGRKKTGCMNKDANNYDPKATEPCSKCCEFDSAITPSGGRQGKTGCMDRRASNYDPTATNACDSCCIMTTTTTTRSLLSTGCKDPKAKNYDSTAENPCDSCCVYEKYGCMDSESLNYDSTATVACDSCCKYPDTSLLDSGSGGGGGFGGGFGGGMPSEGEEGIAEPIKKKSKLKKLLILGTIAFIGYKMLKK